MPKPIQEGPRVIQIDQKKGRWPYITMALLDNGDIGIGIDQNEAGQIMGEGKGVAVISISRKKAKRLKEFLQRVEDMDPEDA